MPTIESLFLNRRDCYAKQMDDGAWVSVKEPLTSDVLMRHLEGVLTVGVYQLNNDSEVMWDCFDFDADDAEAEARKLLTHIKMTQYSNAVLLEHTGGRGLHLWLFFQNRVPAWQAKKIAKKLVDDAGVKCEIFPKQSKIAEGSYGNLVRLPLGIHKKTGLRSKLIEPQDIDAIVPVFVEAEEQPEEERAETQVHEAYPCWASMFRGVKEGGRDIITFTLARRLRANQGFDEKMCRAVLLEWNKKNDPPMKEREVIKCVKSAYEKEYPNIGCAQIKNNDTLSQFCNEEACPRAKENSPGSRTISLEELKAIGPDLFKDVRVWLQSMFHFETDGCDARNALRIPDEVLQDAANGLLPVRDGQGRKRENLSSQCPGYAWPRGAPREHISSCHV
jgi:hypothetical protein